MKKLFYYLLIIPLLISCDDTQWTVVHPTHDYLMAHLEGHWLETGTVTKAFKPQEMALGSYYLNENGQFEEVYFDGRPLWTIWYSSFDINGTMVTINNLLNTSHTPKYYNFIFANENKFYSQRFSNGIPVDEVVVNQRIMDRRLYRETIIGNWQRVTSSEEGVLTIRFFEENPADDDIPGVDMGEYEKKRNGHGPFSISYTATGETPITKKGKYYIYGSYLSLVFDNSDGHYAAALISIGDNKNLLNVQDLAVLDPVTLEPTGEYVSFAMDRIREDL